MTPSAETEILRTVADQWKAAVDAHDPKLVASYFTADAIFQGLHPHSVGPEGVAEYYAAQPLGLTAKYEVLESKRLADDLILGYLTVDFGFVDRPTLTVYLSLVIRQTPEGWLITHYQVSRLA
ncbi:nuclear transport factor 2 family protein [Kribbella sancticallisti]|uniref:Nuclear transport factor 2 family protein n=1 Tax=Kribbella sancticallisti TaxID=460087 RepID=A0ABN2EJ50_9ACTN